MPGYTDTLNEIGDQIIQWSDPEGKFGGFTKVRGTKMLMTSTATPEREECGKELVRCASTENRIYNSQNFSFDFAMVLVSALFFRDSG